mgnify:FL=1
MPLRLRKKIGDKNVILENYLNTINLGAGAYGVQAAARQYFNKDVWDLNLSECATLAGITQAPTKYNPIENPKENAKRRKEVLDHMLDQVTSLRSSMTMLLMMMFTPAFRRHRLLIHSLQARHTPTLRTSLLSRLSMI